MTIAELDDAGRAAVMIMLLEDNAAAGLLGRLDPDELQLLGARMCGLGEIRAETITRAASGFMKNAEKVTFGPDDPAAKVGTLMTKAVGPVKAESLMSRIAPPPKPSPIELVRWLAPLVLAPLIADEHPQAIAVLLVQLDPDNAAQVLKALPASVQFEVVHRIATLGPIQPEALEMLETLLEQRLAARTGLKPLHFGGPSEAAAIINRAGPEIEKRILPGLAKADKALARMIEDERFKFEHLYTLEAQAMGTLLREVAGETLIDALKGIADDEREYFFQAMSSRAADGVRDEIEARGRLRREDVIAAQKLIVAAARRLAADGAIQFGPAASGQSDFV